MTLVDQALRILGNDAHIKRRVGFEIGFVRRLKKWKDSGRYGTQTKKQKNAARQFAALLRKLEIALDSPDLADDVRLGFPLDKFDFEKFLTLADMAADKPLDAPDATDPAKRHAAEAAAKLLSDQGLPVSATRKKPFCRLAAILYGEPRADLFHHCRQVKDRNRS